MSKNKIILGAMAMAMAVPAVVIPASASIDVQPTANAVSDFEYEEVDGGIEITNYVGDSFDVVIPDTIDGKDVVSLGSKSFQAKDLVSVILQGNIENIGYAAFSRNNLTEITIPETVKKIGMNAFQNNNLKDVTLPKELKDLGVYAFANNKLETIDFLPKSIETIPMSVFERNNLGDLRIPDHVKVIETSAFYNSNITSVSIPEGIHLKDGSSDVSIGGSFSQGVFENNKITHVEFRQGGGFTYIGRKTFYKNNIEALSLPKSVINLGSHSFRDNNLSKVEIWNAELPIANDSFFQNVSYGYQLTLKGFNPSTAKDLATTHQYTFEELNNEPTEPTEPTEPSETPQWSFGNTDGVFHGVVPSLTVMGGKSVNEIKIKNVEWVNKETEIETDLGLVILKPDNEGNTLVEIPQGLGNTLTSTVLNVEYEGTNFMDITVVPTPKLDFDFDI